MRVPLNHPTLVFRAGFASRQKRFALLLFAALLFAPPAFATAYIRFANASLQGQPATDKVQIKLDGVTLVDALGYKGASGYFDVDSGTPFLSVWFQGTKLVERQIDIRDDRSYLYVVIGNGTNARFNLHVEHEPLLRLDESMDFFNKVMAAPYAGHPHQDDRPYSGYGFRNKCSRKLNSSGTSTSIPFHFSGGHFPPHFENDKFINPVFAGPSEPIPVGTCKAEIFVASLVGGVASPLPPGMNPTHVAYTIQPGTWATLILVGDGIQTPIEWWVLQHRARFVDPHPVMPGSWSAGLWVAPAVPGLAVALDVDSLPEGQKMAGMLFGFDRQGNTRWYRLNQGFVDPDRTYMSLDPSEYQTNLVGGTNELGNPSSLELVFLSCNRARLTLQTIFMPRFLDIAALGNDYRPIELERVTPLAENCPR